MARFDRFDPADIVPQGGKEKDGEQHIFSLRGPGHRFHAHRVDTEQQTADKSAARAGAHGHQHPNHDKYRKGVEQHVVEMDHSGVESAGQHFFKVETEDAQGVVIPQSRRALHDVEDFPEAAAGLRKIRVVEDGGLVVPVHESVAERRQVGRESNGRRRPGARAER